MSNQNRPAVVSQQADELQMDLSVTVCFRKTVPASRCPAESAPEVSY